MPPRQLAILSFAGLDTNDSLLYPLLGHELGHFIDYSFSPPIHLNNSLRQKCAIRREQVRQVLAKFRSEGNISSVEVEEALRVLVQRTFVCIRELLADLLATRMLGLSFFVAQAEFLKTLADWQQTTILHSGYPGTKFRLSVIFRHLVADDFPGNPLKFLKEYSDSQPDKAPPFIHYLKTWGQFLGNSIQTSGPNVLTPDTSRGLEGQLAELSKDAVVNTLDELSRAARELISDDKCAKLTPMFFERITRLEKELPPSCLNEGHHSFAEIMSASWAYQLLFGEQREKLKDKLEKKFDEYNKTCRLVLKAIELLPNPKGVQPASITDQSPQETGEENHPINTKGVLNASHIRHRVNLSPSDPSHLAVIPHKPSLIQGSSLDVRLGNWFSVARRTKLDKVKLDQPIDEKLLPRVREEIFVATDDPFLIHPADFVVGITLEFIALPKDIMAFVEGKSRLGRMGLIVATATQIAPGFHGVVVLELANAGTIPLEVTPGMKIAQLVFQTVSEPVLDRDLYRGRFHCQIKP